MVHSQNTKIIYVKKGAATTGDGSTWAKAYPDLQQALTSTTSLSGSKEIWVAQGEYRPTPTLDRTVSFVVSGQTFLYGGFIGNETSKETRNWRNNRTVLSGDLGSLFDKSDNSYHVIVAKDVDQTSGIDGFIITQGNANGASDASYNNSGGGLQILSLSSTTAPKINNCEFLNNSANLYGGGLANISIEGTVSPEIMNCFFNGNIAVRGGGVGNYKVNGSNLPRFINCSFSTNKADELGGAVANIGSDATYINCTWSMNQAIQDGGAVYNTNSASVIKNSILWKNFKGTFQPSLSYQQILNNHSNPVIQNNIIQGGYGVPGDKNLQTDPVFIKAPSFEGKFPRTSVISVEQSDRKYENTLSFSGPIMPGQHLYYTFKDALYNKLYISGFRVQVIDFNSLTNGLPTSTLHTNFEWGRIQRPEKSIHATGNKIYFASARTGMLSIDRVTGVSAVIDPLIGESITYSQCKIQDIVIDNENNLLYAPVFYWPDNKFYGLLELNLTNNSKRWINKTSMPISIPDVNEIGDGPYWNGHRIYLDDRENILYYSTGHGFWWWNRTDNTTGVYSTTGGIPLTSGNTALPSNLTTQIFIDHNENKFYIGTHAGLFVWDRSNNTSKIYDTHNSLLGTNLINTIDKNEEQHLIYVGCENSGGLWTLNTITGEQKIYKKDLGNDVNPQMVDNEIESAYYDENDKKLYVSSDTPNGGVWIKDYNNLIPDFGDLALQSTSSAIDYGDHNALDSTVTMDIMGLKRYVNYTSILGNNSLDLGAYEKPYECLQVSLSFQYDKSNDKYIFTPILDKLESGCTLQYSWDFGDGSISTEANPSHTFLFPGTFLVKLRLKYACGPCPAIEVVKESPVEIQNSLCGSIFCSQTEGVSIGSSVGAVGYKLSVQGKIMIEEGQIMEFSRWPDYF